MQRLIFLASAAAIFIYIEVSSWLLLTPVSLAQPSNALMSELEGPGSTIVAGAGRNELLKRDGPQATLKKR